MATTTPDVPLVMQLIVDREMVKQPEWSKGPLMAQAAHAAIAAIHVSSDRPDTRSYLAPANLASMHKIVLQTPANMTLQSLADKLDQARQQDAEDAIPPHYLWVEQPENIPTCLALAPNRKPPALKKILNKCSLLRE